MPGKILPNARNVKSTWGQRGRHPKSTNSPPGVSCQQSNVNRNHKSQQSMQSQMWGPPPKCGNVVNKSYNRSVGGNNSPRGLGINGAQLHNNGVTVRPGQAVGLMGWATRAPSTTNKSITVISNNNTAQMVQQSEGVNVPVRSMEQKGHNQQQQQQEITIITITNVNVWVKCNSQRHQQCESQLQGPVSVQAPTPSKFVSQQQLQRQGCSPPSLGTTTIGKAQRLQVPTRHV